MGNLEFYWTKLKIRCVLMNPPTTHITVYCLQLFILNAVTNRFQFGARLNFTFKYKQYQRPSGA